MDDGEGQEEMDIADIERMEENPEAFTQALLNYFVVLGKPGNTENIDTPFLDVLCVHGGKMFSHH